ncbi:MAG: DUF2274 domain-containing protein [bacterium]|nr:DUF2274 domain-containing protein [bacterium]
MQLAPPEDRTPLRVRVKLIGADRRDFEDYVAYYESVYGTAITQDELLIQLASFTMRSDREFQKWQKAAGDAKGE